MRVDQKVVYSAHKSKTNFNRGELMQHNNGVIGTLFFTLSAVPCAVGHYRGGESHCL